jgi:flagellar hook protein FlgE
MTVSSTATDRQHEGDVAGPEHAGRLVAGAGVDLTIMGNGYFVVRDLVAEKQYATQSGHFTVDSNGYILTGSGARLQGSIGSRLGTEGDLQISAAGLPPGSIPSSTTICYTIDDWGKITVQLSDGSYFLCGQVKLQNFQDPRALIHESNGLYANLCAAGPLPALSAPGSNGLGIIRSGALELENAGEMA